MNQTIQRRRRRRRSNARRRQMFILGAGAAALLLIVILSVYFVMRGAVNKVAKDEIWNHIYIENIDVSGMTADEAKEALEQDIEKYRAQKLTLQAEGQQATVTLGDLGFHAEDLDKLVKDAVAVGKKGSVWSRYRMLKDLQKEVVRFDLKYTIDEETVRTVITEKIPHLPNEAKDATIARQDGKFVITDGQKGKKIDLDASAKTLADYFQNEWETKQQETITLDTVVDEPDVTREHLEQIKDQLGTYSTYFSSGSNRGKNISNAAGRINGAVLLPGEVLSASDSMGSRTEANGYLEAGAYLDGQTVQSLGGGVCQVSSTLYNAVLLAELEVTERYSHSMLVDYVKPSMDAAIAEGYKDFKFKNNTDAPIYVEGYTSGGRLTFTIYGKEFRADDRSIEYVSEETSRTDYKKKFVATSDKVGTLRKDVAGHTGMKAKLWKVVKENGVEVSREAINSSSYMASNATYHVGTKTDNAEAKKIITDAIKTQDEGKIKAAIAEAKKVIKEDSESKEAAGQSTPAKPEEQGGTDENSGDNGEA